MEDEPDLGPLTLNREGDVLRFTLAAPEQMTLDLPPNYENHLEHQLAEVLAAQPQVRATMDLQDLPAISSRQLGVMLALHKALRARIGRLPVTGVSEPVRRLFEMTRTDQFFEVV